MADGAVNDVTLARVQFACSDDPAQNLATASRLVREAAGLGANIVVVQELFEGLYFCQEERPCISRGRSRLPAIRLVAAMATLAAELGVVIPVSFFEARNQAYFNSVAMVDDDGAVLGVYRKSHIPDGPGYSEKFYFNPGDTGFRVWPTRFGAIGVGICWDQWFPEAARAMALMGAEFLLYPTAIGSEPGRPGFRFHGALAHHHARPCRRQPDAGRGRQPHRNGNGRRQDADLLRLVLHRRAVRRASRLGRKGRRSGADGELRPCRDAQRPRRLGPVPRPPAGTLRRARDRRMVRHRHTPNP